MTVHERWLLPEGIEELLPPAARRLEQLRRALLDVYDRWGYDLVIPPFVEFLESLLTGTGHDLDLQTFKLTDQLSGRMMGVRADMTPQVARMDAHQLKRSGPTRLCYMGTVLQTRRSLAHASRSPFQVGAELYGHAGLESDLEIIQLMLETVAVAGLQEVHLDIGHVAVVQGLTQHAIAPATTITAAPISPTHLTALQQDQLLDALQRKSQPDLQALLNAWPCAATVRSMLLALPTLHGTPAILEKAQQVLALAPPSVHQALAALQQVVNWLQANPLSSLTVHLHIDLAELRGYRYHTGVVFAVYVAGFGQAVAQGGRYDEIGQVFGRARPATGFSTDLRLLLDLQPAFEPAATAIYAPYPQDPALQRQLQGQIQALRHQGERVIQGLPGVEENLDELGCNRVLVNDQDRWRVTPR